MRDMAASHKHLSINGGVGRVHVVRSTRCAASSSCRPTTCRPARGRRVDARRLHARRRPRLAEARMRVAAEGRLDLYARSAVRCLPPPSALFSPVLTAPDRLFASRAARAEPSGSIARAAQRAPSSCRATRGTLYAALKAASARSRSSAPRRDALLSDKSVRRESTFARAALLKYLFTELLCHRAAARDFQRAALLETRLLAGARRSSSSCMRCAEAAFGAHRRRRAAHRADAVPARATLRDDILDPSRTEADDIQRLRRSAVRARCRARRTCRWRTSSGAAPSSSPAATSTSRRDARAAGRCWKQLKRLGFRRQRLLQSSRARRGGAGAQLNDAAIKRAAGVGAISFVEAEKRVYRRPRTLYGRGGGVFGLAKLADRLMDTWMDNATLNGNAKVAPWTQSGQRQGFKFLVTQVMGYLTARADTPRRRARALAGRRLPHGRAAAVHGAAISHRPPSGTRSCRTRRSRPCRRCASTTRRKRSWATSSHLPLAGDRRRNAGEKSPRTRSSAASRRRQLHVRASRRRLPARAVREALVDLAALARAVHRYDDVKKPGATRHPPGLKYLLTELVAEAAGGPET